MTYEAVEFSNNSKDDLREKLNKILLSDKPSIGIRMIMKNGLYCSYSLDKLYECIGFEQNNPHHDKDVFEHIMCVLDNVEPKLELRLAALFHDIGKPSTYTEDDKGIGHFYIHHKESARICKDIMTRLKYSNKEIEYVSELVYWHMSKHNTFKSKTIKKFIENVGIDKLEDLFKLQIADISGGKHPYNYESIYKLKLRCEEILNTIPAMSIKDLEVDGYDIMNLGYESKQIGKVLKYLLNIVLEDKNKNQKNQLIELAKEYK